MKKLKKKKTKKNEQTKTKHFAVSVKEASASSHFWIYMQTYFVQIWPLASRSAIHFRKNIFGRSFTTWPCVTYKDDVWRDTGSLAGFGCVQTKTQWSQNSNLRREKINGCPLVVQTVNISRLSSGVKWTQRAHNSIGYFSSDKSQSSHSLKSPCWNQRGLLAGTKSVASVKKNNQLNLKSPFKLLNLFHQVRLN